MDNLYDFDWYDFMWCWGMYELADGDKGAGESVPPLTGDDDENR